jgi:ketosteroid isomerase-like protein
VLEDDDLQDSIRRFGEAWARGDVETLDALLSPTYSHIDVFGNHQDRATWLTYAAGRAGSRTRIEFVDVATRIIGDVAVITGRNDVHGGGGLLRDSQRDFSLRFTQLWVRRDGRWLREAFQATFIER